MVEIVEVSIARLQEMMGRGEASAVDLVRAYVERYGAIDQSGPTLRSILQINPDAEAIAAVLDRERADGHVRGPLHGIPIVLKDNIDTADAMATTAGSLALLDSRPQEDATVAQRLRAAGAVLLGKTNMSEWANFRSTHSTSGWSARGGQCLNPNALDRTPSGSSSGSASAVAASLAAASLGTETDGSILSPGNACGVVGIKPTVGLTSRAGVIPISHTQDTVGPFGRDVRDAVLVLNAIAGPDLRDGATSSGPSGVDYRRVLDPDGLRGARIGVPRKRFFGYSPGADAIAEEALALMRSLGAEIIDPADIPTADAMHDSDSEHEIMLYEFKAGINAYLAERADPPARSLADLIELNRAHAEREMPYFGQELFEQAEEKGGLDEPAYVQAVAESRRLSRTEGIDAVMDRHRLDALVAPTANPAAKIDLINGDPRSGGSSSSPAAMAGYPAITVPAGYRFELPVGINFFGRAYSEPVLIRLAYAFEQVCRARRAPGYLERT